jgi:M6 family metalloprotease-like protein
MVGHARPGGSMISFVRTAWKCGALIAIAGALIARSAWAGPANPQPFTLTQPDGTQFQVRMVGDEWSNALQTLDGFTVLRNDATGFWVYADRTADGALVQSALPVGSDTPVALARNARPNRAPTAPATEERAVTNAVVGPRSLLVILVQFSNLTALTSPAAWQSRFFGASNSVKHHYAVSSYNILNITPASESNDTANDGVVGWLTLPTTHPNTGSAIDSRNQQLTKDAIIAADPFVNFAAYDTNNDTVVTPSELDIIVIVAGNESAFFNACAPSVWGHKWQIFSVAPPVVDGKSVGGQGYAQFGEMHCTSSNPPGQQATIGVMAHELGHLYGLPDLYDIDGSSEGVGAWSLMSGGSWNGVSRPGDSPSLMDLWSKTVLGWISPSFVAASATWLIQPSATHQSAFQFRFGIPGSTGEYFLVENRQRVSYDAALPGSGLLIWHIDETRPNNARECIPGGTPACTSTVHYRVALIQADNAFELERGVDPGDGGDPFPGTSNNRSFTIASAPNSRLWSSASSGASVTSISDSQTLMTATLTLGGPPFTDPTLSSGLTPIKVVHVTELRARIDASRTMRGLAPFSWTDAVLAAGTTSIKAVHVMEMRTAVTQAYAAAGLTPPTFTDASLGGVQVKTIHIQQLRDAVTAIE